MNQVAFQQPNLKNDRAKLFESQARNALSVIGLISNTYSDGLESSIFILTSSFEFILYTGVALFKLNLPNTKFIEIILGETVTELGL